MFYKLSVVNKQTTMLAYSYRKYAKKLDPVREILAKLDAKQTKTGLSLYNQDRNDDSSPGKASLNRTGTSPKLQEDASKKEIFPDLTAARKKAQDRIMAGEVSDQGHFSVKRQTKTNKIPHRLPEAAYPIPHSIDRHDDRFNQPYTIPGSQFDKDKIDININPFGYNRRTLAFDERNVNYVVEWPETWPFKIMSFQGKTKQRKPKRIHRPKDPLFSSPFPQDTQANSWTEPTHAARVLAPVDHPTKPPVFPTRPFVESAVKRGRKIHSKKELRKIVLTSQERKLHFSSQSGNHLGREDSEFSDLGKRRELEDDEHNQTSHRQRESERVDSVPPSTPVPDVQPKEDDTREPENEAKVAQEAKQVLNDIVNQIVTENKTPI